MKGQCDVALWGMIKVFWLYVISQDFDKFCLPEIIFAADELLTLVYFLCILMYLDYNIIFVMTL